MKYWQFLIMGWAVSETKTALPPCIWEIQTCSHRRRGKFGKPICSLLWIFYWHIKKYQVNLQNLCNFQFFANFLFSYFPYLISWKWATQQILPFSLLCMMCEFTSRGEMSRASVAYLHQLCVAYLHHLTRQIFLHGEIPFVVYRLKN